MVRIQSLNRLKSLTQLQVRLPGGPSAAPDHGVPARLFAGGAEDDARHPHPPPAGRLPQDDRHERQVCEMHYPVSQFHLIQMAFSNSYQSDSDL